ncbi:MAG: DNA polymerase [bacterium]|nr:DNA polymerase [bacterium]
MIIGFGIKEELKALKQNGKKIPEYFDIGVAYWLLNPDKGGESLAEIAKEYLRKEKATVKELQSYAEKKLKEYKLEKLFYDIEMPLIDILADIELRGIQVDSNHLKALEKKLEKKLIALTKSIYGYAGKSFNINSPKQLGEILFTRLKIDLKGVKKTRGGAISTNIETLLTLKDKHPIIAQLLEYRELFKLQSTYIKPLQELADKKNRIHTTYLQTGTATGRLSSQNPNLQNIPASAKASAGRLTGEAWGTELRNAFVADSGYEFVSLDYSQIELRILASLSGDATMIDAFNNDMDIHAMTAANVFNVPLEKVTPEMRRRAKTLNFGIVYGMGANAFAKSSGISIAEARKFIEEYFNDFKKIKIWQEQVKAEARKNGFVTNLTGRRRWFLGAVSLFQREAAEAERGAINMPVQGLAADIIKIAMIRVANVLKKKGWWDTDVRMLLTIHDELLFEIKSGILKKAIEVIQQTMESAYELEVPIKVSMKIGKSLGALQSR